MNKQIVLAKRPNGQVQPTDFALETVELQPLKEGETRLKNRYLSMDAGFRYWMNEGSGNNILPAMEIGQPVQGIVMGEVIESNNPNYPVGQLLMARLGWQEYSTITPENDAVYPLPTDWDCPEHYLLGVLGETGMSAFIGTEDIGQLQAGETALISAAAGAVGCVAGQIAKIRGAKVIGLTSNEEKARKLKEEYGFDDIINYRDCDSLEQAIAEQCPDGVDFYFDSIGGPMLRAVLDNLAIGARLALCGAINQYSHSEPQPGPDNLFNLVTKQATMTGFMTHADAERYYSMRTQLNDWLNSGQLKNAELVHQGIEKAPEAFSSIFSGNNFGKTLVKI